MSQRVSTVRRIRNRRDQTERSITRQHLGNFDPDKSRGSELALKFLHGDPVTTKSLKLLVQVLSRVAQLPLPRDYARSKRLLILWFDQNYEDLLLVWNHVPIDPVIASAAGETNR